MFIETAKINQQKLAFESYHMHVADLSPIPVVCLMSHFLLD